jgi:glycyl-tRNA synthetase beta subunit
MGRTTAAAAGFVDALSALRDGSQIPGDLPLDLGTLAGKSQQEIADAIIDAVTPTDGTQDAENSRDSAARAFAELLEFDPTADLMALPQDMVEFFFERFLGNDLVARIQLDVGKAVLDRAPDHATAVQRLEMMQSFVKQEFIRAVQVLKDAGQRLQQGNGQALGDAAIKATLDVFEGWLK